MRPHLASLVADFRRHGLQLAAVTHRGNRRFVCNYQDLAALSARCARAFDQAGLVPGDRVLLWGGNCAEWIAAFFGCAMRGIVAVPLDAAGSLAFAQRVVAEVQPRLLLGDPVLLQNLAPEIPSWSFRAFAATLPEPDYTVVPGLSRETPLQIIFTSGTTAEPKGIVHTHGNVLASLDPLEKEIGKYLRYARLVHPLRILHTLPLSHVFGQFMGLWLPALLTAEVHFEERLQAPRLARLIHDERISVLAAVPRVLDLLRSWLRGEFPALPAWLVAARREPIARRWWRFRPVHRRLGWKFWAFVSGGATLPAELEAFWTTAGFALIQGYGMTETTALVTLNHPFKIARGSIGKPLAGRDVRVGEDGEIMVRGAAIAAQVWKQGGMHSRENGGIQGEEAGWLATGDLAGRNEAGELIFAGRKSDVIVSAAGLNIHPQDLEAALRRQPGLRASLVVAWDSPSGPAPVAVLIPDTAAAALAGAIDAANRDLAPFQQISYWLHWPQPEFPRTSTGKILRRTVQAWAQQSLASGGNAVMPPDPLLAALHELGVQQEVQDDQRLVEDLHLDSLALVQLQAALETRFGMELSDARWASVRTVGDLKTLVESDAGEPALQEEVVVEAATATPQPVGVLREDKASAGPVFPQWPTWGPVRLLRNLFLELVMRPLVWLMLGPGIPQRTPLLRPSLVVANHLTAFDVPVLLYALTSNDRDHIAVAMSGNLLTNWRHARAERHPMVAPFAPLAYALVTALFHVFPLPRGAGLRQSFAYAGQALDWGHHVLVFPEGRRSRDGRLQPFEPGIGLLAQASEVPVQPVVISGLGRHGGRRWPRRGEVTVRFGEPLRMEPGEEPQAFARRLEAAVTALQNR